MQSTIRSRPSVAIIGAGPAGLVTARWLKARGFKTVIFEASADLGGQWNPNGVHSATWPGMAANTSRVMTAFSDLEHSQDTSVYPSREAMHAYLCRYATLFGIASGIRFRTRVDNLSQDPAGGWLIRSSSQGKSSEETFARVVVASGRHIAADVPDIPGIDSFSGALDAIHASQFRDPERYRRASVLVAGCSISALEIAAQLAQAGTTVTAAYRRQRYILPKTIAGIPTSHAMFTRAAALAGERLPRDAQAAAMKAQVLKASGSPDHWGARLPDPDIFVAGISQAQGFLPAVAEGRIAVRPWIDSIEGRRVRFAGGEEGQFDGIVLGTGYRLSMPWLAPELARALELDGRALTLHAHSFHPDLDGLAFVGLYDLIGPYLPVLELQARYIASAWGDGAMPARDEMQKGLVAARTARQGPPSLPMHTVAVAFARLAGAEPNLALWPHLERALLFGPLSPASFRLDGPDALEDAEVSTLRAATAFGAVAGTDFTTEERGLRDLIHGTTLAA